MTKSIRIKKYLSWFWQDIIKYINIKNKFLLQYKNLKSDFVLYNFKYYFKLSKNLISAYHNEDLSDIQNSMITDPNKFWKFINNF